MSRGAFDAPGANGLPGRSGDDDQTVTLPRVVPEQRPDPEIDLDRVWPDEEDLPVAVELPGSDEIAAQLSVGLAAVPYLRSAIRRRARLLCIMALVGLCLGAGIYKVHTPAYQAATSVYITQNPDESPEDGVLTEVALVQSRAVAAVAVQRLGLTESATQFQGSYTVVPLTDRVLVITANAPSSAEAVQHAAAVAKAYLEFRDSKLQSQRRASLSTLQAKVTAARLQVSSFGTQISTVSQQPPSTDRQAELTKLRSERHQATVALTPLVVAVNDYSISSQQTVTLVETGSYVLDPAAPLHRSKFRKPYTYAVGGLLGGLALGLAIVVIGELVTDRLRRRDDIATALGAPVVISVGRVKTGSLLARIGLGRPGLNAASGTDLAKIIGALRRAMPERRGSAATLAVVAVDDPPVTAIAVGALAVSLARGGSQVLVADLSATQAAAKMFGVKKPGVRIATADGQQVAVAIPEPGDTTPAGPVRPVTPQPRRARPRTTPLTKAYDAADALLTLVTLDPAQGAEHLATWAGAAVVVLTAGLSSATKIHSTGEMIRLAGIPVAGAIVLEADRRDETLGNAVALSAWEPEPADADGLPDGDREMRADGMIMNGDQAGSRVRMPEGRS